MNLYWEGKPERLSLDQVVREARLRTRLRRAQRCIDEAEERRDVAFLVDAGLSLGATAGHLMLSRHRASKQLEAYSHLTADKRLALNEQARQAIAAAVLDEPLDEHAVEQLTTRLLSLSSGQAAERATDEPTASVAEVEWRLQQLEQAREDGLLDQPQVDLLENGLAARSGAPSVPTDELDGGGRRAREAGGA